MRAAFTGAHNRVFLQARVGSHVINRGTSLRAETYVFHIRSTFNSGSLGQLCTAAHIYITVHFFELPLPRMLEQNNTIPMTIWR